MALILFDIDHFKNVNDSHGHLIGDHVLRVLTELVTRTTRATDIVCRYGGEEFIVLMPEAGRDEALAMAERLRQEISRMTVVTAGRHAVADHQPGRRRARAATRTRTSKASSAGPTGPCTRPRPPAATPSAADARGRPRAPEAARPAACAIMALF
ncbi:MAG: GGDEF domain-containing protein [Anaerotruncus sp.]|nr:GGDEF domain-containing protein [Anaerotruncus sp.]